MKVMIVAVPAATTFDGTAPTAAEIVGYYDGNGLRVLAAGETLAGVMAASGNIFSFDSDTDQGAYLTKKASMGQTYAGSGYDFRGIEVSFTPTLGTAVL